MMPMVNGALGKVDVMGNDISVSYVFPVADPKINSEKKIAI